MDCRLKHILGACHSLRSTFQEKVILKEILYIDITEKFTVILDTRSILRYIK